MPDRESPHKKLPALFATIHGRSAARPDGYTAEDIERMNIEANRHIPELREALAAQREARLGAEREGEDKPA